MTRSTTNAANIISSKLRHAAELIDLYGIQSVAVVAISVDAWGDVDMHVEWDEFDRIMAVANVSPECVTQSDDAKGNLHRRAVHRGVTWVCVRWAAEQSETDQ